MRLPDDLDLVEIPELSFFDDNGSLVTVEPFQVTKYLVTNAVYNRVMGTSLEYPAANCPRTGLTYNDVMDFISLLNEDFGTEFEVPTANQYEVLIRDGKQHPITPQEYLDRKRPVEATRMHGSSRIDTWPVGQLEPNSLGIYDVTWPCWQWSQTPYADNPRAQIIKGLTWFNFNGHYKTHDTFSRRLSSNIIGFRLALKANPIHDAQTTLSFLKS